MLCPRVLLGALGVREPRLRRWSTILIRHGGGEGFHFFTAEATQVWRQMPQIILQYPYYGVDFGVIRIWYYLQGRCSTTEVSL
jgi:hypothetical protein